MNDHDYMVWRRSSFPAFLEYRKYCEWSAVSSRHGVNIDDYQAYAQWEQTQGQKLQLSAQSDYEAYARSAPSAADYAHWLEYRQWCGGRHKCKKEKKLCARQSKPKYCVAYALYRYYKKHCSKRSYQIYHCFRLFQRWLDERKRVHDDYDDYQHVVCPCQDCRKKCEKKRKGCDKVKCKDFKKWLKCHRKEIKCLDFKCDYEHWRCEKGDEDFCHWLKFYKCYKKQLRKPLYANCDDCGSSSSSSCCSSSSDEGLFDCQSWAKDSLYFYLKRYISCKLYCAYKKYVLWTRANEDAPEDEQISYCDWLDQQDDCDMKCSKKEWCKWQKCYSEADHDALFAFFCWLRDRKGCKKDCCSSSSSSSDCCSSSSSSSCCSSSSSSSDCCSSSSSSSDCCSSSSSSSCSSSSSSSCGCDSSTIVSSSSDCCSSSSSSCSSSSSSSSSCGCRRH